jgi:hypothetical protein
MKREDCMHSEELFLPNGPKVLVEMYDEETIHKIRHKILKVSNMILRSSMYKGADTVMIHPDNRHLVDVSKMSVVTDEATPRDVVFVKSSFADDLKVMLVQDKMRNADDTGTVITISLKPVGDCAEEEVDNYRRGCRGYVNIVRE